MFPVAYLNAIGRQPRCFRHTILLTMKQQMKRLGALAATLSWGLALAGCNKGGANTRLTAGHRDGEALAALPGADSGQRYQLDPNLRHSFSKDATEKTVRRVKLGEAAPDFTLKTLGGKTLKLSQFKGDAALFVFADTVCPCVLAYNDRLKALDTKFRTRGLRTVFVFSNGKTDTPQKVATFARQQKYPWTVALDLDQQLFRAFDASCSTEAFLFDRQGRLRYHGRIDDDTFEPGAVRERDLQSAVVAVLDGRAVPRPETKAFGCAIPRI